MTDPRPTLEQMPHWPRWLNQWQAAAYVGVSANTFKTEMRKGVWPGPGRGNSLRLLLWDRALLDAASNRLSGLPTVPPEEEIGYARDTGYFKRRLEAVYGEQGHPAPGLPADRR